MESHSTSLVFPPTTSFRFLFRSDNGDAALPFSCRGRTSACGPTHGCFFPHPPPIAQCSLLLRWALPVPGVDAGFYKRMRSSQHKKTRTARSPPEFVFCRHWPAAGETQPGPLSGNGGGSPTSTRPAPSSSVKPTSFSPVLTQCARR